MKKIIENATNFDTISNVYGLARSFLAMGLFLTLIFNNLHQIIFDFDSVEKANVLSSFVHVNFFYLLRHHLFLSKIIALTFLIIVAIGYRPRYTVLIHWWITYSFLTACPVIDGGDQIAAIITLFLIPIGLMDPRIWVWSKPYEIKNKYLNMCLYFVYLSIRVQAAAIYFFSAIDKMKVNEWINGTALYYWFTHPIFGLNATLRPFIMPLVKSDFVVVLTWGVIIFELALALALVMEKKYWQNLFFCGVLFHLAIVFIHGLSSFFFSMTALLILYLLPFKYNIRFKKLNLGHVP